MNVVVTDKVAFLGVYDKEYEGFMYFKPPEITEEKYEEIVKNTGIMEIIAIRYEYYIKKEDIKIIINVKREAANVIGNKVSNTPKK